MTRKSVLSPYTLKLDQELWREIDQARMITVGTLHPEGVSKKKFIETAIKEYLLYLQQEIFPRIEKVKQNIEAPVPFYIDNGVDVIW